MVNNVVERSTYLNCCCKFSLVLDPGQVGINQHKEQEHPSIFSFSEKPNFKESLMDYYIVLRKT